MKYSIRGNIKTSDGSNILVNCINFYTLWKLEQRQIIEEEQDVFTFEVWLDTEWDKINLFDELRTYVDFHGGLIDWHECSHDEAQSRPCKIAETYEVV